MKVPGWITNLKRPGSLWGSVVGWVCICIGVFGVILPLIPGLPFLLAGLFILSARYRWASVCLMWVRRQVRRVSVKRSRRKEAVSTAGNPWKEALRATKMGSMSSHRFFRIATLFLIILSTVFAFAQQDKRGRKYKAPPETMKVDISVIRASTGKPIPNAAVIFHPVNDKGKVEGAMELKTDLEGKTTLDVIPIGSTVRLQIIANGFQTFGNDYVANADAKQITIKMERPKSQYSIYKGNATGDQSGQAQETTGKPASKPN
jgi:uncharacterized membrane protein YbaN (DUF454 family)